MIFLTFPPLIVEHVWPVVASVLQQKHFQCHYFAQKQFLSTLGNTMWERSQPRNLPPSEEIDHLHPYSSRKVSYPSFPDTSIPQAFNRQPSEQTKIPTRKRALSLVTANYHEYKLLSIMWRLLLHLNQRLHVNHLMPRLNPRMQALLL